jgi:glycosyltransferase involved in cell wall biosynthesis
MEGNRLLWLTDTYDDHNGVSMVLQSMHEEITRRDLPIDILTCSNTLVPGDHLIVVKPVSEINLPVYRQQPIRVPNYLEVRKIFISGGYDRIICSTEGPMSVAALYLKKMFSVRTCFYLHTDWIMFASTVMKFEETGIKRVKRLLRFFYNRYDGIFVLNTEQQGWLSGEGMKIDQSRVFLTAHWVDRVFSPGPDARSEIFGVSAGAPVLLFAGRLSEEKGIFELPELFSRVSSEIPGLKLVIAGTGPAEAELREALPDAIFLGWVNHEDLHRVYSSADLLVLPSKFDTFSCVVLEAISCGLPVIAYNTKGPRDILEHGVSGFLAEDPEEMATSITRYFAGEESRAAMKNGALSRARAYEPGRILDEFLYNVGLGNYAEACRIQE